MNSSSNDPRSSPAPARHTDTRLATAGHDPASHHGFVNPPVYHVSTVLYPTAEDYVAHRSRYQYGRRGTHRDTLAARRANDTFPHRTRSS